jgi:TetR/AcrR family transcriptional regulator, transcriptional repressor of aconitase
MPKVSQSYLDARRAEILDAAIVCFSRQGFHRTTMQDIVKQSRLSPGAIYNYFDSKEEIIEAISEARHAAERTIIIEASKEPTFAGVVARIRDGFFGELKDPKERRRRRVSIQLWAEAQRNPKILKLARRTVDDPCRLLNGILSEAKKRGEIAGSVDPEATARFLIAAFHGIVLQVEWNDRLEIERLLRPLNHFLNCITQSS